MFGQKKYQKLYKALVSPLQDKSRVLEAIDCLAAEGISVKDVVFANGQTPLHVVVPWGDVDSALFLARLGVDVNAVDIYGNTVLHIASFRGMLAMVNALLSVPGIDLTIGQVGIDPATGRRIKDTALELAECNGHHEVVAVLSSAQRIAQPHLEEKEEKYPTLYKACLEGLVKNAERERVRLFREKEISEWYDVVFANGQTPLHVAVACGHVHLLDLFLVTRGINYNAVDNDGNTALHLAADRGDLCMVRTLFVPFARNTPLKELDLTIRNGDGRTAIELAKLNGHPEVVQYLLSVQRLAQCFCVPAKRQTQQVDGPMRKLIHDLYLDCMLSGDEKIDTIKELIQQTGVNAHLCCDWSPLHVAVIYNHNDLVRFLLKQEGLDVNAQDQEGNTALHFACETGNAQVVKLLLKRPEIDCNIRAHDGRTPMDRAIKHEQPLVMPLLSGLKRAHASPSDDVSVGEGVSASSVLDPAPVLLSVTAPRLGQSDLEQAGVQKPHKTRP